VIDDPTRVPRIVFWIAMGVWGGLEVRLAVHRGGRDTGEDAGSIRWSFGATVAGLLAALISDALLPEVVAEERHGPFLWAGAGVVLAGVSLRIWAVRTLGRFFTYQVMTADDHVVVSNGPYRLLRHPSYTGLLLSCAGAGIATANPVSFLLVAVIPLVGLVVRIRVEESVLATRLGDDYRRFTASRKRLVPWVW
jgi:protein-S-isoprenylcysteine O-methyltransferase Ste14